MAGEVATLGSRFASDVQVMPQLEAGPDVIATGQAAPSLQIDPEFRDLIPPLSRDEVDVLKENLSTQGCRDKLVVWKDHNIILDGHHRYQICTELGLNFETREIELPSRADAKIWILKNQRGRRNLNESQRAMLAVKLEAVYGEQAKERMRTRTDLGQNLGQHEAGRSSEKAAKDMGVSRQSVTFAKKVVTDGIPELKQMVEATILAVSTAAKVAKLAAETQKKVQVEIDKKAQEKAKDNKITSRVTTSEVDKIIKNLNRDENKIKDPGIDENLVNVEQKLNGLIKKLSGFETTTQPEKLVELIAMGEKLLELMRSIGLKSPSLDRKVDFTPTEYQLEINAKTLRFLMDSIVPADDGIKLKFDSDGLRIIEHDRNKSFISSAFLPKRYFSKYELEPCEACLRRPEDLARLLRDGTVQIFIEPETEYHHDRVMKIYSGYEDGSVLREAQVNLTRPEFVRKEFEVPNLRPTCKAVVSISSKDFVGSLKDIKKTKINSKGKALFARFARLSIEDSALKIVSREDGCIQKIPCNVFVAGEADSEFNIARLSDSDIGKVIEISDTITIGIGKDYPLVMDLAIGKVEIKYLLGPLMAEDLPKEYEEYRGVLVDQEGNPAEPVLESTEKPTAEPTEKSAGTKEVHVLRKDDRTGKVLEEDPVR